MQLKHAKALQQGLHWAVLRGLGCRRAWAVSEEEQHRGSLISHEAVADELVEVGWTACARLSSLPVNGYRVM
jgi:hypothetical protein